MSDENRKVIEGEVVGETPHQSSARESGGFAQGGLGTGQRPRFAFYSVRSTSPIHEGTPMGGMITLALFFTCLFQWGFLAALGFAFFYAICAGIGFYYNLRRMMQEQAPMPWLCRIVSWIVCLGLVSRLV